MHKEINFPKMAVKEIENLSDKELTKLSQNLLEEKDYKTAYNLSFSKKDQKQTKAKNSWDSVIQKIHQKDKSLIPEIIKLLEEIQSEN